LVLFVIIWGNINSSKSTERFSGFTRQTFIAASHTIAP
jgi:hypothetical protein